MCAVSDPLKIRALISTITSIQSIASFTEDLNTAVIQVRGLKAYLSGMRLHKDALHVLKASFQLGGVWSRRVPLRHNPDDLKCERAVSQRQKMLRKLKPPPL